MANRLRTLLLGNADHAEFCAAVELLAETSVLVHAVDVSTALTRLDAEHVPPDVIVVAQPSSGSTRADNLEPLLARVPLARVLILAGSWCEGEQRSGQPIPGTIRILWHQWSARWQQELTRWYADGCPAWSLPVTATEDDRLLYVADEPHARIPGRAAVVASESTAGWLADACHGMGIETCLVSPRANFKGAHLPCQVVLFEVESLRCDTPDAALGRVKAWQGVPVIGLCSFPRLEDVETWSRAGVKVLLAQPVLIDDLRWHIANQFRAGRSLERHAHPS